MASVSKPHTHTSLYIQKQGKCLITYKLVYEIINFKWPWPRGLGSEASYNHHFTDSKESKCLITYKVPQEIKDRTAPTAEQGRNQEREELRSHAEDGERERRSRTEDGERERRSRIEDGERERRQGLK
jgi:hypothetical protein